MRGKDSILIDHLVVTYKPEDGESIKKWWKYKKIDLFFPIGRTRYDVGLESSRHNIATRDSSWDYQGPLDLLQVSLTSHGAIRKVSDVLRMWVDALNPSSARFETLQNKLKSAREIVLKIITKLFHFKCNFY